ncbi:MAG TPA: TPM domain-containing protein [Bryobacteraceae bacterium]|nr:TPM domain-containing protein [Bryobacteraceae bacterium]
MTRLLRLCAVLLISLGAASAVDWKALQPQGYVSDFSGVVDTASKIELGTYCATVERATGAQIALVTIPTLEGEPIEDVANTIFRAWGIGQKGSNEGIMLLLVTGDRRSRLEVGYGLEPYIPDGMAGSILREMRPALRQNQYGEALKAAAQMIGSRIAQAKGVSLDAPLRRRIHPRTRDSIPWPVLLGGLFVLLWLLRAGGAGYGGGGGFLPGLILGGMMGRSSWGGRGSGGFGGYDSGDSFGGFGGGDSGGGGASSDW